jgi:hypothetical protein
VDASSIFANWTGGAAGDGDACVEENSYISNYEFK